MSAYLRCLAGPYEGRNLSLRVDRPLRLPLKNRGAVEGELAVAVDADGWLLTVDGTVPVELNGTVVQRSAIAGGDLIKVGKLTFEVVVDEAESDDGITELPVQHPGKGDTVVLRVPVDRGHDAPEQEDSGPTRSSRGRSRRKISAARVSSVEASQPKRDGLLKKVSSVFRREGGRRADLDALLRERDALLRESGRLALEQSGGVGLPDGLLKRLAAGETVSLSQAELKAGDLERYRGNRQHLVQLDHQIEMLRQELALDSTYGEGDDAPVSHAARQEAAERAHQAMDGVGTEELLSDEELIAELADETEESSSGRRRRSGRP